MGNDLPTKLSVSAVIEELNSLYEAKEDQKLFIDKFGQERFNRFNKLKNRLQKVKDKDGKSASTDMTYLAKHMDAKDLDTLLDRADNRQYTADKLIEYDIEGREIPDPDNTGTVVGMNNKFTIYKVENPAQAIYWARYKVRDDEPAYGYWCIAGRFKLANDDAVKVSQANQYFYQYLERGFDAFYFCIPKDTAEKKVVICAYNQLYGDYEWGDFQAWDAWNNEVTSMEDLPDGCLDFEDINYNPDDPNSSFEPIRLYDPDFEEEENQVEVYNYEQWEFEHYVNSSADVCNELYKRLATDFPDFTAEFMATETSDERNGEYTLESHVDFLLKNSADQNDFDMKLSIDCASNAIEEQALELSANVFIWGERLPLEEVGEITRLNEPNDTALETFKQKLYNIAANINEMWQAVKAFKSVVGNSFGAIEPYFDEECGTYSFFCSDTLNSRIDGIKYLNISISPNPITDITKSADSAKVKCWALVNAEYTENSKNVSEDLYEDSVDSLPIKELKQHLLNLYTKFKKD